MDQQVIGVGLLKFFDLGVGKPRFNYHLSTFLDTKPGDLVLAKLNTFCGRIELVPVAIG